MKANGRVARRLARIFIISWLAACTTALSSSEVGVVLARRCHLTLDRKAPKPTARAAKARAATNLARVCPIAASDWRHSSLGLKCASCAVESPGWLAGSLATKPLVQLRNWLLLFTRPPLLLFLVKAASVPAIGGNLGVELLLRRPAGAVVAPTISGASSLEARAPSSCKLTRIVRFRQKWLLAVGAANGDQVATKARLDGERRVASAHQGRARVPQ